jgi:lysophospholipase L1-like esterase
MRVERVLTPKPDAIKRVLVVGESSVQGFPWPRNLNFVSILEVYLRQLLGGRPVEVINGGMTAAASFVVRDIAEQSLAALDPDLLIIYTGHNEFFGAFGVASLQFGGRSVPAMRGLRFIRSLGIYQAMDSAAKRMRRRERRPGESVRLIEEMAAIDNIEPGGDLHQAAAAAFEANLRAMVRAARRHGVPVLISTVVKNESGLVPIAFYAEDKVAARALADEATAMLADAAVSIEQGLARCDAWAAEFPSHAMVPYVRGQLLARARRHDEAIAAYQRAIDLDAMPWRATSMINGVARRVASEEKTAFLDLQARLHEATGKAIGFSIMADHVHPSLDGQIMTARELAIAAAPLLADGSDLDSAAIAKLDFATIAEAMGTNRLEEAVVYGKMSSLFENPPMSVNNAHLRTYLRQKMSGIVGTLTPYERRAVERWNESMRGPAARSISEYAGEEAVASGEFVAAASYYRSAAADQLSFTVEQARLRALCVLASRQLGPLSAADLAFAARGVGSSLLARMIVSSPELPGLNAWLGILYVCGGNEAAGKEAIGLALRSGVALDERTSELLRRVVAGEVAGTTTAP